MSDIIVNFELVLASGDTVNANAMERKDLWIALKGGCNNFGVVTRFDIATFEQGKLWGEDVYYGAELFPEQVQALADYTTHKSADEYAHLLLSVGYAAMFGGTTAQNLVYYTKPQANPPTLQPFVSMRPQIEAHKKLHIDTLKGFADDQAKCSPPGQRSGSIYPSKTLCGTR